MPIEQTQIPPTHTETITYRGREFAATKDAFNQIDQAEALVQDRIDDDPANDYESRVDEATQALRASIRTLSEKNELIYVGRVDHMATTFNGHITSPSEQRKLDAENAMEAYAEEVNRAEEAQRVAEGMNNGEPVAWSEEWEADAERQAESGYDVDEAVLSERNPTEIVSMGSSAPLMGLANQPETAPSAAVTPDLSWAKGFTPEAQAKFAADPDLAAAMKRSVESHDAAMNQPPGLRYRMVEFKERVGEYLRLAVSSTEQRRPIREEWRQFKAHVQAMAQPLQPSWVPAHPDPRKQIVVRDEASASAAIQRPNLTRAFKVRHGRDFDYYVATPARDQQTDQARHTVFQRTNLNLAIRAGLRDGTVAKVSEPEYQRVRVAQYSQPVRVEKTATDIRHADFGRPNPNQQYKATGQMYTLNGPNGSHMSADKSARDVFYALSRADWVSPETRARLVNEAVQAGAMRQGATHSVMPDVPERFRVQKQQKEQALRNQQSMTH